MKTILITGANGGMGRATVDWFAARGYRVFALDRDECAPRENVIPICADVTDERSVTAAFEAVSNETQELCGILHLAGIYMLDSLVEMQPSEFERAFRVNLGGAFLINRTFLPLLKKSKIGALVANISSEAGSIGRPIIWTMLRKKLPSTCSP